ncbi:hypothetical protein SNEBB_008450 [Seison nebaliae]|nr:hypothetical protein SNEBB_008450 [Seison nebaliae]
MMNQSFLIKYVETAAESITNATGCVTCKSFIESFTPSDVTLPFDIDHVTGKELQQFLQKLKVILTDNQQEKWTVRVNAMKQLRLVISKKLHLKHQKEFYNSLRQMNEELLKNMKDLRSQIRRETCITLSYIAEASTNLPYSETQIDQFFELHLPVMLTLINNAKKIMSSSVALCIVFILAYIQSPKFITILCEEIQMSKAKEVRRFCLCFLKNILAYWPGMQLTPVDVTDSRKLSNSQKTIITSLAPNIGDALMKGLTDADVGARLSAKDAYRAMKSSILQSQADIIYSKLDKRKKKELNEESDLLSNRGRFVERQASSSSVTGALSSRTIKRPTTTISQPGTRQNSPSKYRQNPVTSYRSKMLEKRDQSPSNRSAVSAIITPGAKKKTTPDNHRSYLSRRRTNTDLGKTPIKKENKTLTRRTPNDSFGYPRKFDRSDEERSEVSVRSINSTLSTKRNYSRYRNRRLSNDQDNSSFKERNLPVNEIIGMMGNQSQNNNEEGLYQLKRLLERNRAIKNGKISGNEIFINKIEMKKITETFLQQLHSYGSKTNTNLFESLETFISYYGEQLNFWLYSLLLRIWHRLTSKPPMGIKSKFENLIDVIQSTFTGETQFLITVRYLTDDAQISPPFAKGLALNFISNLFQDSKIPKDILMDGYLRTSEHALLLGIGRPNTSLNENIIIEECRRIMKKFVVNVLALAEKLQNIRSESTSMITLARQADLLLIYLFNLNMDEILRFISDLPKSSHEFISERLKMRVEPESETESNISQKDSNSSSDNNSQLASHHHQNQSSNDINDYLEKNVFIHQTSFMKLSEHEEMPSPKITIIKSTLHNLVTRMKDTWKKVNNRLKIDNMESKKISTRNYKNDEKFIERNIEIIKNCRPNDLLEHNTKNGNHTNGNNDMALSEVARPLSTIIESPTIMENNNDRILNGISMELYYSIMAAHEFEKMTDINCRRLLQLLFCCHRSSSISIVVTSMKLMKLLLLLIPVQMAPLLKLISNELFLNPSQQFLIVVEYFNSNKMVCSDMATHYSASELLPILLHFMNEEVRKVRSHDNMPNHHNGTDQKSKEHDCIPFLILINTMECAMMTVKECRTSEIVANLFPSFLPALKEAWDVQSCSNVRRAVVYLLTEYYIHVGDELYDLLTPIDSAKIRLLEIFVAKRIQNRN